MLSCLPSTPLLCSSSSPATLECSEFLLASDKSPPIACDMLSAAIQLLPSKLSSMFSTVNEMLAAFMLCDIKLKSSAGSGFTERVRMRDSCEGFCYSLMRWLHWV
eukprot:TRINITY_DN5668_c0_g1_i8.p1 TRINITY_DN5668_c0_g1~~TRINITY_DN5668_c0_g1_i8.p1  ORF type:complete len:105 (-),score=4.65 TRINITY_DN5668_c0_g1_i8:833-1147(-)